MGVGPALVIGGDGEHVARMKYSCKILAERLLANNNMSVSILLESPLNPLLFVAVLLIHTSAA